VTIQFRPYGVKLDFTPVVTPEDTIQLKVTPEVSALDYSNAVTISGYTIPALSTRRADTQVELKNGQSFAISGLLDHRTTDLLSKTPGIGDIPVLGDLFKSKSINHSVVELLVIVTPTIVDPLTDSTPPEEPQFAMPTLDTQKFDKSVSKQKPQQ
jgi:pilus assembly protein CpaC